MDGLPNILENGLEIELHGAMYTDEQTDFLRTCKRYLASDARTDFVVNVCDVSIWLGMKEKSAKRKIVNKIDEGVHYIIIKDATTGGRPSESLMMSVFGFNLFCLRTPSKKTSKVIDYYMTMEMIFTTYNMNKISHQKEELERLRLKVSQLSYPQTTIESSVELDELPIYIEYKARQMMRGGDTPQLVMSADAMRRDYNHVCVSKLADLSISSEWSGDQMSNHVNNIGRNKVTGISQSRDAYGKKSFTIELFHVQRYLRSINMLNQEWWEKVI